MGDMRLLCVSKDSGLPCVAKHERRRSRRRATNFILHLDGANFFLWFDKIKMFAGNPEKVN